MKRTITVFGSSMPTEIEYKLAYETGKKIGEMGFNVCNGGYYGTMEASAKGCLEKGGNPIGVTVREFGNTTPNPYIKRNIVADTLFERLRVLIDSGDAYVVLPGNTGTLVELSLVWEYYNKGSSNRMIFVHSYWKEVIKSIEPKREISFKLPDSHELFFKKAEKCKLFVIDDLLKGIDFLMKFLMR